MMPPASAGRALPTFALGMFEILSWGSSYYLLAVLAKPIAEETGWPLTLVAGGQSLGLVVAGLLSPRIGKLIGWHGGRPVLLAGTAALALGLAMLGLSTGPLGFALAWILLGAGMGASLYDAAFATLGRLHGAAARRSITTVTLFGGFASTACWPLSAFLLERVGWRDTCLVYAALHVCLSVPLVLLASPRPPAQPLPEAAPAGPPPLHAGIRLSPGKQTAFRLLTVIVTLGGLISSLISVHLLTLLQAQGISLAAAVTLGMLVGPAQVGARVVEMAFGTHYHPIWTLISATVLVAAGLALLFLGFPLPALALLLYGAGNGIWSIARGTLPLALFGPADFPMLMGRLALPSQFAQAAAPAIGAYMLTTGGAHGTFALLCMVAGANFCAACLLFRTGVTERADLAA
ncbi:MFS transporter [Xanthobacter sp. VNH20]